jgi:hypothetical protein
MFFIHIYSVALRSVCRTNGFYLSIIENYNFPFVFLKNMWIDLILYCLASMYICIGQSWYMKCRMAVLKTLWMNARSVDFILLYRSWREVYSKRIIRKWIFREVVPDVIASLYQQADGPWSHSVQKENPTLIFYFIFFPLPFILRKSLLSFSNALMLPWKIKQVLKVYAIAFSGK